MAKSAIVDRELWAITLYVARDLPSESLKSKIKNSFQQDKWDQIRSTLYAVGVSWWTKASFKDNPLHSWLDGGLISQWEFDYYEGLTSVFQNLWFLIQASEPFVRKEACQQGIAYPFENAESRAAALFKEIVQVDTDSAFLECLNYLEASAPKTEAALRIFATRIAGEDESRLKVYKKRLKGKTPGQLSTQSLPGWRNQNFWLNFVFDVCEIKARSNQDIKSKLNHCCHALSNWAEILAKACRNWPSYSYSPGSGVIKSGTARGGAYS
ncbi:hypothetical protein H6F90_00255 [Trichocoleus sp. FACHB-591]|uniref:hypothetical protein n=1 Tax=Trichocoleus sp. FACHB-591 TaxID=2692872 RepID=UPI0016882908|nr:hypothetical protein [Trichocoleus sp. FACHB-591]MBD2093586.1 hypothetical protein [Trichocoleus sp. FACHB-591]